MKNKRIKAIVDQIEGNTIADIGTDHGYIPIFAIKMLNLQKAIACDIEAMPLFNAKKNIEQNGLSHLIETRLGNGLAPLKKGEVDSIIIAGLGGDVMQNILIKNADITSYSTQLILSPHTKIETIRRTVHSLNFNIKSELIIKDEKYYHILNCIKSTSIKKYTEAEYYIGKPLYNDTFLKYLLTQKNKLQSILNKINKDNYKKSKLEQQLIWINDALAK